MNRYALMAALLCVPAAVLAHHGEVQHEDRSGAGWPVETFQLVDHRGAGFDDQALRGRWTLVLFGDTHCATPCAAALDAVAGVFRRIAGTEAVKTTQVVFVSLDPQRDTPAQLGRYLAPFEAAGVAAGVTAAKGGSLRVAPMGPRFIAATGPYPVVRRLADDLRALDASAPVQAAPAYRGSLLLVGPDGVVRTEFLPPFDVQRLTAAFLLTRARR